MDELKRYTVLYTNTEYRTAVVLAKDKQEAEDIIDKHITIDERRVSHDMSNDIAIEIVNVDEKMEKFR